MGNCDLGKERYQDCQSFKDWQSWFVQRKFSGYIWSTSCTLPAFYFVIPQVLCYTYAVFLARGG